VECLIDAASDITGGSDIVSFGSLESITCWNDMAEIREAE
jgi:hypothetical protein